MRCSGFAKATGNPPRTQWPMTEWRLSDFCRKAATAMPASGWGEAVPQTLMEADAASQLVSRYPVAVSAYP
jgi:hypothetical protein